ncbi:cation efflux family-domain-containing protein [Crepidotus variabilis]|uniref:Cation efflux family-domain-containing protein n=1 Tax=Crepidotus variabilis TaxID=179855 RepID=A0A9P6EI99_9AGAR|nr:cation efflux family-domain-containing protein [Crepidotus variabilis]
MTNSTAHEHDQHEHEHSHSHSLFGHSHSHGEEHTHDAEQILAALKGSGDRGSYITLVGLFTNVALTLAKGLAGWFMHSASLMADAGHSMSDLLGDFVTLFCWRLSRKPPSEKYPYGFAKFETFGTSTISILLIGGALGIGFHSYHLLMTALTETAGSLPPGPTHDILRFITSTATLPDISLGHSHGHGHDHGSAQLVDVNAAWFAAASVLIKEWLYRITKVVADEEKSPVLLANAIHHRSDAYSSLVAFFAILGSWFFPALPLDPLGGLLVSAVIFRQGYGLFAETLGDLTDAGVSPRTKQALLKALTPFTESQSNGSTSHTHNHNHDDPHSNHNGLSHPLPPIFVSDLRARRAGSLLFVDLTARIPGTITVSQASSLEEQIEHTLKTARKEIKEVRITFKPLIDSVPPLKELN